MCHPNPHNYPEVDHKNGVRTDYSLTNLRWGTSEMNSQWMVERRGATA
jgi:hypothetical protein